jgi:hypothetical protein
MASELFDLSEDLVDIAGILAQDSALQHQGIGFAGAIAHLSISRDSLIGVDPLMGLAPTTATRRSVILSCDGRELRLTF